MNADKNKRDLKGAMSVGASVAAVIALLPWFTDFFIAAYLLGAFAAVWFAARKQKRILSFSDGAQLGFLSGFYGLLAASTIYDLLWQFLHFELWHLRNADRLLSIFAKMIHDAVSPSAWIVITIQIIVAAILAGAIGAPSGILAVKIFPRRTS